VKLSPIEIHVAGTRLGGQLVEPLTGIPGVLFIHGWAGSQERDMRRATMLARLGFVCLTFDMRGHGENAGGLRRVTREENLQDVLAAYDALVAHRQVDPASIAVVGSSYGGYLAVLLTARRPVRWLALRVPALYRDEDWQVPKFELDRRELAAYRQRIISHEVNVAIQQARRFAGDVLIVESEQDEIVPHPVIASYLAALISARSVTYRILADADHALSSPESQRQYDELLARWMREMIFGARS
jgi:pimeloyl-ACP methyl ester carboxylesterase